MPSEFKLAKILAVPVKSFIFAVLWKIFNVGIATTPLAKYRQMHVNFATRVVSIGYSFMPGFGRSEVQLYENSSDNLVDVYLEVDLTIQK